MVDLDLLERLLIRAALEGRAVTYGEVLAFFERRLTRVTVAALCKDLGRIEERRAGEAWPDLACLVVRKADGLPGEGYFTSLRQAGAYAGPSVGKPAHAFVAGRQARARAWALERAGGAARSPASAQRAEVMSAASRCR
jgi:hypothetical protein